MPQFYTLFLSFLLWNDAHKSLGQSSEPPVSLKGVQGKDVDLPCNITPPTPDDEVALVLWYRDDSSTPFYSLDARRGGSPGQGRHSSSDSYATRTYFSTVSKPATLQLAALTGDDKGVYICRVDFRKARTRYSEISLSIIIPPKEPVITNENGEIVKNVVGPYKEGDRLMLLCESEGGQPLPKLTWWQGPVLLDDTYGVTPQKISFNKLELLNLHRGDLFKELSCLASNNDISLPASTTVQVDMTLKPLKLEIDEIDQPLSANKVTNLKCRTAGARPNVTITWWFGGRQMKSTTTRTTKNGNITISTLSFKPSMDDAGKYISCRAENPAIPESALENGWKLSVYHKPHLTLRLGSKLRHSHIQQGYDVYLECNIVANPWVTEIGWKFEGQELQTNTSAGIIISNQSLVLQKVGRSNRGRYSCIATNSEGQGESKSLHLKVQFAPSCKSHQKIVHGAARHESVQVQCEVEADPSNVSFYWRFNSTKEVPGLLTFTSNESRSTATFIPRTEHDYGTLLCWASNKVGVQKKPCGFKVVPAGPPDTVKNCSLRNQTEHVIEVECIEGYNGGLLQYFVMEVHDKSFQKLRANITASDPRFQADNLPAGTNFLVVVYAVNAKGRSHPLVMRTSTLPAPQTQSRRDTLWQMRFSPVLVVLVGIVAGLVLIACIIVIVMKLKARYCRQKGERTTNLLVKKNETNNWANNKRPNGISDTYKTWDPVDSEKLPSSIPLLHENHQVPSKLTLEMGERHSGNKQDNEEKQINKPLGQNGIKSCAESSGYLEVSNTGV
ncbi:neural cell adhesion molecule 2-like [Tachypleus tridentatus]|uniref:neural cell adhesion molecule 2-like n=1 Tax=Tachypleus tridentatus TaxID=6853 RepID=UPI003FD516A8